MTHNLRLIVDSGATKATWVVIEPNGEEVARVNTAGINAMALTEEYISAIVMVEAMEGISPMIAQGVGTIWFYGAGCVDERACHSVKIALEAAFPEAERIEIESDMIGAARALLGHREGIACIMGTGSNSCRWNGTAVVDNVPSLGFILGDEGSGASLGRRLVSDVFKRQLPERVCREWHDEYGLDMAEVVRHVYREPGAGAFLASFAPFLHQRLDNEAVRALVVDEMRRFFKRNVAAYGDIHDMEIGFVGSIAEFFAEELKLAAAQERFNVGKILRSPINQLIEYHAI